MSDDEIVKNASGEPVFGREAELISAGYVPKADEKPVQETFDGTPDGILDAAADLAVSSSNVEELPTAPEILAATDRDPREAVSVKQAAAELTSMRADIRTFTESAGLNEFAKQVDAERLEILKKVKDPAAAVTELGLSGEDVEGVLAAEAEENGTKPAANPDTAAKPGDPEATVEGLDPEVQRALKNPQVRAAIQDELGKAEAARQGYTDAINLVHTYAQANLLDSFPELANLPVDQWDGALQIINQHDPQRVSGAMGVLQRANDIATAQAQWQQHQAAEQQRQYQEQLQSWKRQQDALHAERSQIPEDQRQRYSKLAVEYLGELGVSESELHSLVRSQPLMHSAAFNLVLEDALLYREIKKAPAKAIPKPIPPVQRPGVSGASRAYASEASIQNLYAKLDKASGKAALKIAAQISRAQREAAR